MSFLIMFFSGYIRAIAGLLVHMVDYSKFFLRNLHTVL